jgi:hypothetical protein
MRASFHAATVLNMLMKTVERLPAERPEAGRDVSKAAMAIFLKFVLLCSVNLIRGI